MSCKTLFDILQLVDDSTLINLKILDANANKEEFYLPVKSYEFNYVHSRRKFYDYEVCKIDGLGKGYILITIKESEK